MKTPRVRQLCQAVKHEQKQLRMSNCQIRTLPSTRASGGCSVSPLISGGCCRGIASTLGHEESIGATSGQPTFKT